MKEPFVTCFSLPAVAGSSMFLILFRLLISSFHNPPPHRCGRVSGPHPNQGRGLPDGRGPPCPPPSGDGGECGVPSWHPALLQHLVLTHHASLAVPQWPRYGRGSRGVTEPEQQLGAPAGGHHWNVGGLSRRRRDSEGPGSGEPVLLLLRTPLRCSVPCFYGDNLISWFGLFKSNQHSENERIRLRHSALIPVFWPLPALIFWSQTSLWEPKETCFRCVQDSLTVPAGSPHSATICTAITAALASARRCFFFYLKHAQPKGSQCLTPSWDASGPLGRWRYRLFLHAARWDCCSVSLMARDTKVVTSLGSKNAELENQHHTCIFAAVLDYFYEFVWVDDGCATAVFL